MIEIYIREKYANSELDEDRNSIFDISTFKIELQRLLSFDIIDDFNTLLDIDKINRRDRQRRFTIESNIIQKRNKNQKNENQRIYEFTIKNNETDSSTKRKAIDIEDFKQSINQNSKN